MQVIPCSGKRCRRYQHCFSRHQLWHLWLSSPGSMHSKITHLLVLPGCFVHTCHWQGAHASAYDLQLKHARHAYLQVTAMTAWADVLAYASRKHLWCKTGMLTRSSLSLDSRRDRQDIGASAAAAAACFCMIIEMLVSSTPNCSTGQKS